MAIHTAHEPGRTLNTEYVLDNRAILRRVSVYYRTVRYETRDRIAFGPAFPATVLEWERAVD